MIVHFGPELHETPGIGALTLPGVLAEVVARHGERDALVLDDELRGGATVRWTYDDLAREVDRVARGLLATGVAPGERVGVLMGNRPEAVASLFAVTSIGAVAVLLSTFATPAELAAMVGRAGADVVVTQTRLRRRRFGDEVEALAVVGEDSWVDLLASGEGIDPSDLAARRASVHPDDEAVVIFSSGTTAEPKGVRHGHRAVALQCWLQAQIFGRHAQTRMFSALPLFWTAGLNTAMGGTLAAGGCWVMQEAFDAETALALLARERVTEPYTLPHQTVALAERPEWDDTDLSSLRCVYGKGAYARHRTVEADPAWQMPVGYGLTETCSFVAGHPSTTSRERAKVGMGPLLPGAKLRVLDDGELAVAGPTLMLGYLGHRATETFDEFGFFPTGDLGHVDAAGIVHWEGRATELIKTRGANVAPAELETALRAHPAVKLSRIVGLGDDPLDQQVVACIVTKDGFAATAEQIQAFLRERVAPYKVPSRVLFFAEGDLPMTASATKVRDDRLLELVQAQINGDR